MSEPTIRQRMLDQQARHVHRAYGTAARPGDEGECACCGHEWPCPDRVAADAVLATLDAEEFDIANSTTTIPDPLLGVPVRDEATP